MRWVRTDVLPVPAPATTSIGPWTCSMASRWRSSGVNGTERELDFDCGIRGQDITRWDEDGCAERAFLAATGAYRFSSEMQIAFAAMAAVSERRIAVPSEAEIHPFC